MPFDEAIDSGAQLVIDPKVLQTLIRERMQVYGTSYADAMTDVKKELAADAARMNLIAPDKSEEVRHAFSVADEALNKANEIAALHESCITTIEDAIFNTGDLRRKAAIARSVAIDEPTIAQKAHLALAKLVEWKLDPAAHQARQIFLEEISDAVWRREMNAQIEHFCHPLETLANENVKMTLKLATDAKIDLPALMAELSRGARSGRKLLSDSNLYREFWKKSLR